MEPRLTRTMDQWIACAPSAMARQSEAAISFAFEAAKNDIITLYQALPAQAVGDYRGYEARFLAAWKRGVIKAGPWLFGREVGYGKKGIQIQPLKTPDEVRNAASKWELRPNVDLIEKSFGPMSPGEKKLLAGMVSFYNAETGAELCRRAGLYSPQNFAAGTDDAVRLILAELTLYYPGW